MYLTFLQEKKHAILERWLDIILSSYPSESKQFFKLEKDRFNNPVGTTMTTETSNLYEALLNEASSEEYYRILDKLIIVWAVQEFSPSQVIGFIFSLKSAIREEFDVEQRDIQAYRELLDIEAKIDVIGLLSFEVYMTRREKLYEIKANELQARTAKLMERLNRQNKDES